MNNLSINRKNNIYKIYSKLNNSYRRYIIERDGQKSLLEREKHEIQRLEVPKIIVEPTIENKPCSQPIILGIYRKIWYGQKLDRFYRKCKCLSPKFEFVNCLEKLEKSRIEDTKEKRKIQQEKIKMQKWMEKERIKYEKKVREDKIRRRAIKEELERLKEEKRIFKENLLKKKTKEEKEFDKKYEDFKEKLQAIKEQRWIGKTSSGSKYWFLGVESVDIKDLTNEYADVILYQKRKNNRENYKKRNERIESYSTSSNTKYVLSEDYLQKLQLINMSSMQLLEYFENLFKNKK